MVKHAERRRKPNRLMPVFNPAQSTSRRHSSPAPCVANASLFDTETQAVELAGSPTEPL